MTREDLKKLWFTDERIFIETTNEAVKSLLLEDFPRLKNASAEEREDYRLSPSGIHWESIDEDLSFDGFFTYNRRQANEQQNAIQELMRKFPMLNITELARAAGISPTVMRHYACNVKRPSKKRKKEIEEALHNIGKELSAVKLL
ncbi:MAG: DUF2442 domain-containing protein [Bacteroidia bacterium]|nr:DUF2442 domain-containing protein [Bacteroidia bacterium]